MEISESKLKQTLKSITKLNSQIESIQKENKKILIGFYDSSTSLLLHKNIILNLLKEEACREIKNNQNSKQNDNQLADLLSELLIAKSENEQLIETLYRFFLEKEDLNKKFFLATLTIEAKSKRDKATYCSLIESCKALENNINEKKKELERKIRDHDKLVTYSSVVMKNEIYLTNPSKINLEMYDEKLQSLEILDKVSVIIRKEKEEYAAMQNKIKVLTKNISEMKKNTSMLANNYNTIIEDSHYNNNYSNFNSNYQTRGQFQTNFTSNQLGQGDFNAQIPISKQMTIGSGGFSKDVKDNFYNTNSWKSNNAEKDHKNKVGQFLPQENIDSKNNENVNNPNSNNRKKINKQDYNTNVNMIYEFSEHDDIEGDKQIEGSEDAIQMNFDLGLDQTIDSQLINFPDKINMKASGKGIFSLTPNFSKNGCQVKSKDLNNNNKAFTGNKSKNNNTELKKPNLNSGNYETNIAQHEWKRSTSNNFESKKPNTVKPNNEEKNNYNTEIPDKVIRASVSVPKLNFGEIHNKYKNDKSVLVKESRLDAQKNDKKPPKYQGKEDKKLLQILNKDLGKSSELLKLEHQLDETENTIENLKNSLASVKEKFKKSRQNNKVLEENLLEREEKIENLLLQISNAKREIEAENEKLETNTNISGGNFIKESTPNRISILNNKNEIVKINSESTIVNNNSKKESFNVLKVQKEATPSTIGSEVACQQEDNQLSNAFTQSNNVSKLKLGKITNDKHHSIDDLQQEDKNKRTEKANNRYDGEIKEEEELNESGANEDGEDGEDVDDVYFDIFDSKIESDIARNNRVFNDIRKNIQLSNLKANK